MPIYEFKCMDCDKFMELLVMNKQDEVEMVCSHCGSGNLERILSTTNHAIPGGGSSSGSGATSQTRTCSSGSCTTYTIPGP